MKGESVTLTKKVFYLVVCCALVYLHGCGSIGWLPSLSLAVAGIDRTERQSDQTDRKRLILKAEARLKWRLKPAANRSVSQPVDDCAAADFDIGYRTGQTGALYEWERRERNRVIAETNQGWKQ